MSAGRSAKIERHRTGAFVSGRRAFLVGSGGAIMALPWLAAVHGHSQVLRARPRRFLLWAQGQGTQYNEWAIPGARPTEFTLGRILEPIAPFRDRMLFLRGIDNVVKDRAGGDGHASARRTIFTCQASGAASIDRVLWERIREPSSRSPIHLAVGPSGRGDRLYAAPGDPVEAQGNPNTAFGALFRDSPNTAAGDRERLRRRRVLETVRESFASFRSRLGREDRERLDLHADKLDELDRRLVATRACGTPQLDLPPGFDPASDADAAATAQIEIAALAFACNLSPVITLEWSDDHDPAMFADLHGGYQNWHDMVHAGETRRGIAGLITGYRYYAERFAQLLRRFAEIPEEGGTMLDHTTILWTSDFGYGAGHNGRCIQTAIAGTMGPDVPMGRCHSFVNPEELWTRSRWATNNLYVSILQAFGGSDSRFGDHGDGVQSGPVTGIDV